MRAQSLLQELPPEIRFEPLGCPPEAIHQANAAENRTGENAFQPVDKAIARIQIELSPSRACLESWAQHPDERVPIALLTRNIVRPLMDEAKLLLFHLVPRAIQEAQSRGEIWTPLLDALSSSIWNDDQSLVSLQAVGPGQQHYLETTVEPWIKQQKDPNVLHQVVLQTKSPRLVCFIARTATFIDSTLFNTVLEICPPAVVDFVHNDHLPSELQETLPHWLVHAAAQIDTNPFLDVFSLETAYHLLAQRGIFLQSDHIDRLIGLFEQHNDQSGRGTQYVRWRAIHLLYQHARQKGDEDVALQVIALAEKGNVVDYVFRLFDDAARAMSRLTITPRLARAVLKHFGRLANLLEAVANIPEVRQDPEIRSTLLESREPDVLFALAQDERAEEFSFIFRQIVPKRIDLAVALLKGHRETAARTLSRTDLLPLLQARWPDIRLEALTFLGDLQDNPEVSEPTAQHRSL